MFTWICPQCGREVPPAYNECPDCTGKGATPTAAQPPQPPPGTTTTFTAPGGQYAPQATQYAMPVPQFAPQPPQQFAPQAPQYAPPPPQYPGQTPQFAVGAPQPRGLNLPPWLMSILFAAVFLALFAGVYFGIRYFNASDQPPVSAAAKLDTPAARAAPGAAKPNNTLQKYVEVIGLRLTEDPKHKAQARFVVVNHSGAEIADLSANVNLSARTAKSGEEAVGSFSFKLPSLGPYETKDMSSALNTKLRVYELPDWQNLTAEVQITSPAQ